MDAPYVVNAERDGLASIDDEATILCLDATYASVPLEVVANKRRKTVTVEVGREIREMDVVEAFRVAAAILAASVFADPPPKDRCVDCAEPADATSDEWGAPLCGNCQDKRVEGWAS